MSGTTEPRMVSERAYIEACARKAELEWVARAARKLVDLHGDVLGLPTLSQENLDAAAVAWSELRTALDVVEMGRADG